MKLKPRDNFYDKEMTVLCSYRLEACHIKYNNAIIMHNRSWNIPSIFELLCRESKNKNPFCNGNYFDPLENQVHKQEVDHIVRVFFLAWFLFCLCTSA
jgi:hypothetical protein